jgi:NhaP-type Na+/H+ and K+/H+ antiporter
LLFAIAVVLLRLVAFFLSLVRTPLDQRSRLLIAWFGPRGLSSLLLILVPVFAGVPGSEQVFVICCLVVLLSVALHGGSLMLLGRKPSPAISVSANQAVANTSLSNDGDVRPLAIKNDGDHISLEEFRRLELSGAPVLVLDVRSDPSFGSSSLQAQGALRIPPDQAVRRIAELNVPRQTWIIAFCA